MDEINTLNVGTEDNGLLFYTNGIEKVSIRNSLGSMIGIKVATTNEYRKADYELIYSDRSQDFYSGLRLTTSVYNRKTKEYPPNKWSLVDICTPEQLETILSKIKGEIEKYKQALLSKERERRQELECIENEKTTFEKLLGKNPEADLSDAIDRVA